MDRAILPTEMSRPHHLLLAWVLVACGDASGGSGGGSASTAGDASSENPCVGYDGGNLTDACRDAMIAHCATLSRDACVAFGPTSETGPIGCALAGVVTEENDCKPGEPIRCIAGVDHGDSGSFAMYVGDDVIQVLCTGDRDFCPTHLLGGPACASGNGPPACSCPPG